MRRAKYDHHHASHVWLIGLVGLCEHSRASKLRQRIESLLMRMKRRGFLHPSASTATAAVGAEGCKKPRRASDADDHLFRAVCQNNHHVLRRLFPEVSRLSLRPRPHNFALPVKDDQNSLLELYRKICLEAKPTDNLIRVTD